MPERSSLKCPPSSSFSGKHGPCFSGRSDPPSIKTYPQSLLCYPYHPLSPFYTSNIISFLYHFIYILYFDVYPTMVLVHYWWCPSTDRLLALLMYDRTSTRTDVNKARKKLFVKKSSVQRIPPTCAALEQHVKRAVFQGGHVWGQTLVPQPVLPSPSSWQD